MNWKTRQMFSDREHGIVSGLSPISMTGGGNVPYPSYEDGTGLEEAMSIDLFQQGDQDINQALNMMSGSVSPNVADIGPTAPTETIEETVTVTEDQGPVIEKPTGYEIELQGIKEQFEELLRRYAAKLAEANGTIEQLIEQAKAVELAFSNKVTEIQAKHNIEGLDETLLTEEFMQELTTLIDPTIPGMQGAGVVHSAEDIAAAKQLLDELGMSLSPQRFLDLPKAERDKYIKAFTILSANRGTTPSSVSDRTRLDELLEERRSMATDIGKAARASYSSIQDPVSHFFSARKAGERAELAAKSAALTNEIATEQALLNVGSRYGGASSMGRLPADVITDIYGDTGDLSAAYEDMIDALTKGTKVAPLEMIDVMFMERYQRMPPGQAAYQGTKTIQGQTVTFPEFYATARKQVINALKKEPAETYERRKIDALKKIFTLWINT